MNKATIAKTVGTFVIAALLAFGAAYAGIVQSFCEGVLEQPVVDAE